jgi:hypothetical protein
MTKHVEGEAEDGSTDLKDSKGAQPDSAASGLVFQYVLTPMIGGATMGTTAATWAAAADRPSRPVMRSHGNTESSASAAHAGRDRHGRLGAYAKQPGAHAVARLATPAVGLFLPPARMHAALHACPFVPAAQAWLVRVVDSTKDGGEVSTTEVEYVEVRVPPYVGAGFTINCHARLPGPQRMLSPPSSRKIVEAAGARAASFFFRLAPSSRPPSGIAAWPFQSSTPHSCCLGGGRGGSLRMRDLRNYTGTASRAQ